VCTISFGGIGYFFLNDDYRTVEAVQTSIAKVAMIYTDEVVVITIVPVKLQNLILIVDNHIKIDTTYLE
jgi:hypothetical protein